MGTRERSPSSESNCSSGSSSSSYYGCRTSTRSLISERSSNISKSTKSLTLFDDVKIILSRHDKKLSRIEDDLNFMVEWLNEKFDFIIQHESTFSESEYEEDRIEEPVKPSEVTPAETEATLKNSDIEARSSDEDLAAASESHDSFDSDLSEDEDKLHSPPQVNPLPIENEERISRHEKMESMSPKIFLKPAPKPKPKQIRSRRPPKVKTDNEPQLPSQCDICGKFLKDPSSLRQHKQIHLNVRPFQCPEPNCGKSFRRKFHMQTHLLIHSGVKKHQCGYCGKLFLLQKDLVSHERIHTGERPFQCPSCPKSFNLKSHLVMHSRTHTGEKPYTCEICSKCFTQSNSLRLHKKKIHQQGRQERPKKKIVPKLKNAKIRKTEHEVRYFHSPQVPAKMPIYKNQLSPFLPSGKGKFTSSLAILQPVSNHSIEFLETRETQVMLPQSTLNLIATVNVPITK